jgi:hypothetical protein
MSRREADTDLESLLVRGRTIRPVSASVRARMLERARAATKIRLPPLELLGVVRTRRWSVRAVALVAALVAGVASASLGLTALWPRPGEPAGTKPATAALPRYVAPIAPARAPDAEPTPESAAVRPEPPPSERPEPLDPSSSRALRPATEPSARSAYAAELELLQRAHSSYGSRDFESAFRLLAEHSRRFPNGVLAEQREALRVRSFAGAGRSAEARRAAAAFANRFPRSVLLPRLQQLTREDETR